MTRPAIYRVVYATCDHLHVPRLGTATIDRYIAPAAAPPQGSTESTLTYLEPELDGRVRELAAEVRALLTIVDKARGLRCTMSMYCPFPNGTRCKACELAAAIAAFDAEQETP